MKRKGYAVVITIQEFTYDSKVGSAQREIVNPTLDILHGNWSMGDYRSAQAADDAIASLVHIEPPFHKDRGCDCDRLKRC